MKKTGSIIKFLWFVVALTAVVGCSLIVPDSGNKGKDSDTGTGKNDTGTDTDVDSDTDTDTDADSDTDTDTDTDTDADTGCTAVNTVEKCGDAGLCVDGYCCNEPCDGLCEACDLPDSEGNCTPISGNSDPQDDCPTCHVCNGEGSCVNVIFGEDLMNECEQQAPNTCGLIGYCDGSDKCAYWSLTTPCGQPVCENVANGYSLLTEPLCNGSGECGDTIHTCGGFLCNGSLDACSDSCVGSDDCSPPEEFQCVGGVCRGSKGIGEECYLGTECSNGICEDGYCCNVECSGACRVCNLEGAEGTCTFYDDLADKAAPVGACGECKGCNGSSQHCETIPSGQDWNGDCTTDFNACNGEETCNGSGSCYSEGSDPCVLGAECANSCHNLDNDTFHCNTSENEPCGNQTDHVCTGPDTCDGMGGCQPNHKEGECGVGIHCGGTCTGGLCSTSGNPCCSDINSKNCLDTAGACNGICDDLGICSSQGTSCIDDCGGVQPSMCTNAECLLSGFCGCTTGNATCDLCVTDGYVADICPTIPDSEGGGVLCCKDSNESGEDENGFRCCASELNCSDSTAVGDCIEF